MMVVDLLSLQICSVTGLKAHSYIRLYRVQCSMSCARKLSTIYLLAHSRKSRVGMRGNGNYASAVAATPSELPRTPSRPAPTESTAARS
jgi:hypothetical protein